MLGVWEIAAIGRHFIVYKRFTLSLHKKSNLYKDLTAWLGRPLTNDEMVAFDLESVIGSQGRVLIEHREKDGSVYADVKTLTKAADGQKMERSLTYTRVKDRQAADESIAEDEVITF